MKAYTNHERAQKGGYMRAMKLTPKQRTDAARKAAVARWSKKKKVA